MALPWQQEVEEFCKRFDVPIQYLAATLSDPKVVPMIRGKAFEFSAAQALRNILPEQEWRVEKPTLNAQLELKDIDVKVTHLPTSRIIRVECKLSGNGGFRSHKATKIKGTEQIVPAYSTIKVKCMRSRTLGESKVKELAPKMDVSERSLSAHADSYRAADFDVVLTTIGNAFYRTNKLGEYEFAPTSNELNFLERINPQHADHKVGAFEKMYLIKASSLCVGNTEYPLVCGRRNCDNKNGCGFIPNYPIIHFADGSTEPDNGWVNVEKSLSFFNSLAIQPQSQEAETIAAEQLAQQVSSN